MLRSIIAHFPFLRPPVFPENEEKTRRAMYMHYISLVIPAAVLIYEGPTRLLRPYQAVGIIDYILLALSVLGVLSWWAVRRGYVAATSIVFIVLFWTAANGIAATVGIRDASFIANFVVMMMAALLLGWLATGIVTLASMIAAYIIGQAEFHGSIAVPDYDVTKFAQDVSVVLLLGGGFLTILTTGLENAIKRSRNSVRELEQSNTNLQETQADLQARSAELVSTNSILQKRTERLRAIAEVARTATSVQDFEQLLPLIASIISQQLSYYRVRIFLVDQPREYAILSSQAVDGISTPPAEGERVKVGARGVIGSVTQSGVPALVNAKLETLSAQPEMGIDTESQLVLPLKVSGTIIGVIDLQSRESNVFDQEEISNLTILADQVAISIQNALSAKQVRDALREAEIASKQVIGQVWQQYTETIQRPGYRYDGIKSDALKERTEAKTDQDGLFVPVQLRGQTIGRLRLKTYDGSRQWTADELAIIEATAERVALALEGARLLEDAQKRASREAFLSEMAAKLSTSFQLDSILRDTVEELGQTLAGSTVSFQLVNPSVPLTAEDSDNGSAQKQRAE